MKKNEFLDKLYEALCESLDESTARIHIDYYRNYIENEVKSGKEENTVTEELGNPRLIAKSIVDAGDDSYKYSSSVNNESYTNNSKENQSTFSFNGKNVGGLKAKIMFYAICALVIFILVAIIGSVLGLFVAFVKLIIKCIVPIAIVAAIYMIIKIINGDK